VIYSCATCHEDPFEPAFPPLPPPGGNPTNGPSIPPDGNPTNGPSIPPDGNPTNGPSIPPEPPPEPDDEPTPDDNGDPPEQPPENRPQGADPVFLDTGAFYHRETDLALPGVIPIVFRRVYHNQYAYNGRMGYNWDFSLNKRLEIHPNGDVALYEPSDTTVTTKLHYRKSGSAFITPAGFFRQLAQNGAYYCQHGEHGETWTFDSDGLLVSFTDRNGNALSYEYDEAGRFFKVTGSFGHSLSLAYDGSGRIASVTDSAGRQVAYTYSGPNLVSVLKTGDRLIGYTYDARGNLTSMVDAEGETWLRNGYDANDRVTNQIYNGASAFFAYDTANGKTTYTDWRGHETDYHFDPATGNQTRIVTYTAGLRASDPASYVTAFAYDGNLQKTRENLPDGSWIKYTYDANGNLTERRRKKAGAPDAPDPGDLVTAFTYDPLYNLPLTVTDPNGNTTTIAYDANGNAVAVSPPLAGATLYEHDASGRMTLLTAPDGIQRKYEYDTASGFLHRVISDFGPGGFNAAVDYTYNGYGKVTSVVDPEGHTNTIAYNAYGLPAAVTRSAALHIETRFDYDANGHVIRERNKRDGTGTNWAVRTFTHDQRGKVTGTVKEDAHTVYVYDPAGNLSVVIDAEGKMTHTLYDERGLPWKRIDANGGVTEFSHTPNGALAKLADANGNETLYAYDDFGRLTRTTWPDGSHEDLAYDKNGNVTARRTRKGDEFTYVYDALDRLVSRTCPDTGAASFTYDASSRLTSAADANGRVGFAYDSLGRPVQESDVFSRTVGSGYDLNGNRTTLTYPDGSSVTAAFDAAGRLAGLADQTAAVAAFAYNPLSQVTRVDYANGTYTGYAYDALDYLQTVNHRLAPGDAPYAYTRDRLGHALAMAAPGPALHGYTHDDTYQVTRADYPDGGYAAFAYDALGNRISAAESTKTTEYAGNNLNQYTNITVSSASPWLISSPAYDGNGNTLSDGENAYAYDSLNRLVGVFTASNTVEYSYDALDRLVEKRVYDVAGAPVAVEQYTYDGADVLCEYGADGAETARYVLAGLDRPVRRTVNGVHYYYHADALGSVTEISDESGAWVESYTYDVFGAPKFYDAAGNLLPSSAVGNTTLFTGRRYESESGLYHYRARFYSPKLGRFLQPDPIGYAGGINIYAYCGNGPVNFADPWGLCAGEPGGPGGPYNPFASLGSGGSGSSDPFGEQLWQPVFPPPVESFFQLTPAHILVNDLMWMPNPTRDPVAFIWDDPSYAWFFLAHSGGNNTTLSDVGVVFIFNGGIIIMGASQIGSSLPPQYAKPVVLGGWVVGGSMEAVGTVMVIGGQMLGDPPPRFSIQ
jgi:RHS repeat-associated protein